MPISLKPRGLNRLRTLLPASLLSGRSLASGATQFCPIRKSCGRFTTSSPPWVDFNSEIFFTSPRWNCHPQLMLMVSRTAAAAGKVPINENPPSSNEAKSIVFFFISNLFFKLPSGLVTSWFTDGQIELLQAYLLFIYYPVSSFRLTAYRARLPLHHQSQPQLS